MTDQEPKIQVYQIYQQADMTEGSRGLIPTYNNKIYLTEQDAWDEINTRGGVMGRRVGVNCYDMDKLKAANAHTWQDYKRVMGHEGDYAVRTLELVV